MSWKYVLHCGLNLKLDIDECQALAKAVGYRFFLFNNRVLLTADKSYIGIDYEDLR